MSDVPDLYPSYTNLMFNILYICRIEMKEEKCYHPLLDFSMFFLAMLCKADWLENEWKKDSFVSECHHLFIKQVRHSQLC